MFGKIKKMISDWHLRGAREDERKHLIKFRKKILSLGEVPEDLFSMYYFTLTFCRTVSELQDCIGKVVYFGDEIEESFEKIFQTVGRTKFGINRTKWNEPIGFENLWFGGIFDLKKMPMRHWINNKTLYVDFSKRWGITLKDKDPTMAEVICFGQIQPLIISMRKIALDATEFLEKDHNENN